MQKVYFSEQPASIKYMPTSDGRVDVWLRTNIEEVTETNEDGSTYPSWKADENYFRARVRTMPLSYVEENFEDLLNFDYTEETEKSSLEKRIEDIEAVLAELFGGGII